MGASNWELKKGPKSITFQNSTIFCVSTLKHTLLHMLRAAQNLIYIASWSSIRNQHNTVALPTGNGHPKKAMELFIENARLPWCSNDSPYNSNVLYTLPS